METIISRIKETEKNYNLIKKHLAHYLKNNGSVWEVDKSISAAHQSLDALRESVKRFQNQKKSDARKKALKIKTAGFEFESIKIDGFEFSYESLFTENQLGVL